MYTMYVNISAKLGSYPNPSNVATNIAGKVYVIIETSFVNDERTLSKTASISVFANPVMKEIRTCAMIHWNDQTPRMPVYSLLFKVALSIINEYIPVSSTATIDTDMARNLPGTPCPVVVAWFSNTEAAIAPSIAIKHPSAPDLSSKTRKTSTAAVSNPPRISVLLEWERLLKGDSFPMRVNSG